MRHQPCGGGRGDGHPWSAYLRRSCFPTLSVISVFSNRLTHIRVDSTSVAQNNEPSPKSLFVAITDLLFSKQTRSANPRCFPIKPIIATTKTTFIHIPHRSPTVVPLPKCIVRSAVPCLNQHGTVTQLPLLEVLFYLQPFCNPPFSPDSCGAVP